MNTPVDFSIAKLLKEKGFDEIVKNAYLFNSEKANVPDGEFSNKGEKYISAPIIAEVVMWLYEKHGIWICVATIPFEKHFMFEYSIHNRSECLTQDGVFDSPTEAYEAAIEYTLKNLLP